VAKGKYSARAANRAVALDNEVIAELRSQLAAVQGERDELYAELDCLRRDLNGEVLRRVTESTATEREALHTQLADERAQIDAALVSAAEELTDVLVYWYRAMIEKYGRESIAFHRVCFDPIDSAGPSLLRVFDALCPERAGELMERIITAEGELPWQGRDPARARKRRGAHKISHDVKANDHRFARRELKKKFAAAMSYGDEHEPEKA